MRIKNYLLLAIIFNLVGLTGCDKQNETDLVIPQLSPITAGDAGHVCGMTIKNYPGPKAQAFIRGSDTPLKFCSTTDLFAWLLQPDTPAILRTAYVHDMGAEGISWDNPSDKHYIPAKEAIYVINHKQPGAMGPTLASFRDAQAAEAFIKGHGGKQVLYSDISLDLLAGLLLGNSH